MARCLPLFSALACTSTTPFQSSTGKTQRPASGRWTNPQSRLGVRSPARVSFGAQWAKLRRWSGRGILEVLLCQEWRAVLVVLLLLLRLALRRLAGLRAVARRAALWVAVLVVLLPVALRRAVLRPAVLRPAVQPVGRLVAQLQELQVWDGVN